MTVQIEISISHSTCSSALHAFEPVSFVDGVNHSLENHYGGFDDSFIPRSYPPFGFKPFGFELTVCSQSFVDLRPISIAPVALLIAHSLNGRMVSLLQSFIPWFSKESFPAIRMMTSDVVGKNRSSSLGLWKASKDRVKFFIATTGTNFFNSSIAHKLPHWLTLKNRLNCWKTPKAAEPQRSWSTTSVMAKKSAVMAQSAAKHPRKLGEGSTSRAYGLNQNRHDHEAHDWRHRRHGDDVLYSTLRSVVRFFHLVNGKA